MMDISEARGWAAQAWCDDRNASKVLDTDLAETFAEILLRRVVESEQVKRLRQARETMREILSEDEGFNQGYVANVAMLLHDRYGITDYDTRNQAASDILKLIFG